jgi:hypothetical protein
MPLLCLNAAAVCSYVPQENFFDENVFGCFTHSFAPTAPLIVEMPLAFVGIVDALRVQKLFSPNLFRTEEAVS